MAFFEDGGQFNTASRSFQCLLLVSRNSWNSCHRRVSYGLKAWEFSGDAKMWEDFLFHFCSVKTWASNVGGNLTDFFNNATGFEKLQEVSFPLFAFLSVAHAFIYLLYTVNSGNNAGNFTSPAIFFYFNFWFQAYRQTPQLSVRKRNGTAIVNDMKIHLQDVLQKKIKSIKVCFRRLSVA